MAILYPGMLFTAAICWIVAIAAFFVSLSILGNAQGRKLDLSFGSFWFLFSLVWLFIGLRHFFASLGDKEMDKLFFIVGQIFIFLHMVPAGYYIYLKLFKRVKLAAGFGLFFLALALLGIWTLFSQGVIVGPVSDYTTEYAPSYLGAWIFVGLLLFGVPLFIFHSLSWIFRALKRKKAQDFSSFLASFSVVIYALLGYFDELGFMKAWPLILFRLCYLLAIFLVYLSTVLKETSNQS